MASGRLHPRFVGAKKRGLIEVTCPVRLPAAGSPELAVVALRNLDWVRRTGGGDRPRAGGGRLMPPELTSEQRRALIILAARADGATAYCLTQLNGVASHIIAELVGHELIDARVQFVATRDSNCEAISVVRLTITNAGGRVIAGRQ